MAAPRLVFEKTKELWTKRFIDKDEGSADPAKVEALVNTAFTSNDFYPAGMDFGCGRGRFVPLLDQYCGHIYVADIVPEAVDAARQLVVTSSSVKLAWPPEVPWVKPRLDLFWSFFTFQHIVDDGMFETFASELLRVMRPGCRILLLENAFEHSWSTKARAPQLLARALGMKSGFKAEKVSVRGEHKDHWFIDGIRG